MDLHGRSLLQCGLPWRRQFQWWNQATNLYGDNFGVIQSATIPEGELKKKHVAIAYHYVREYIAGGMG
jgi:hypothetical protein